MDFDLISEHFKPNWLSILEKTFKEFPGYLLPDEGNIDGHTAHPEHNDAESIMATVPVAVQIEYLLDG